MVTSYNLFWINWLYTFKIDEIKFKESTDNGGKCCYPINKLSKGNLAVSLDGYFPINDEYGNESGLDLINESTFRLPLFQRPNDINEMQIKLFPFEYVNKKSLECKILANHGYWDY